MRDYVRDYVIVTGAAGFIGRHLVDALLSANVLVLGIDIVPEHKLPSSWIVSKRFWYMPSSVTDHSVLAGIFGSAKCVIHLAAVSRVRLAEMDPILTVQTNVLGTASILDLASINHIPVLFASSREVYNGSSAENASLQNLPINVYGLSKLQGELLCQHYYQQHRLPVTVLRLSNVVGAYDNDRVVPLFIDKALENAMLQMYGNAYLDFVTVEYVVQAIKTWLGSVGNIDLFHAWHRLCRTGGDILVSNVGGGRSFYIADLANIIIRQTDSRSQVVVHPPRNYETNWYAPTLDRCQKLFGPNVPLTDEYIERLIEYRRKLKA